MKTTEELIKGLRQNKGHIPTKGSEYNRKEAERKKKEREARKAEQEKESGHNRSGRYE